MCKRYCILHCCNMGECLITASIVLQQHKMFLVLFQISVLLVIAVEANHLECPPQLTRLINTDDTDLNTYTVQTGNGFADLISLTPYYADRYFSAYNVPNTGSFSFKETFLLLGLTTRGYRIAGIEYFVKSFSLRYANATDTEYQDYTTTFSGITSIDEVYFPFQEPLIVRRIEFTVLTFEDAHTSYDWKLNLLGCSETDAVEILTSSCPVISSTMIPSSTAQTSIATTAIITTATTTTTTTTTITVSASVVTVTATQTTAGSSCTMNGSTQQLVVTKSTDSCTGAITAAILIPLLLIIVFSVLLTVIFIWIYKTKISSPKTSRDRSSTLKAVTNVQLYTPEDFSEQSHDHICTDDEMIENEAYHCRSGQILIKDVSNQLPIDDNEYSSIDVYYPSNTSNASSNKYEYISTASNVLPSSPTDIIYEVDSTPNPCYTTH